MPACRRPVRSWALRSRTLALACSLGALALATAGCSESAPLDAGRANGVMTVLGLEYGEYLAAHRNVPPADFAQFRTFVESRPQKMAEYRVTKIDDLLTSPRDGQPLQVVAGVKAPITDARGYAWAAYESTGVDGKRLASNSRGAVSELSAEEFAQIFPAPAP